MSDENPIAAIAKGPWLRWALHGFGGGTAIAVGLAAIAAVKERPEFLPQLLSGNVLIFGIGAIGLVVFDRRLQSYAELHSRSVAAQEQLAANVGALVAKDDLRAREQDALLGHLARQSEKILQYLEEQRQGHA
jgi:hypothetical protein